MPTLSRSLFLALAAAASAEIWPLPAQRVDSGSKSAPTIHVLPSDGFFHSAVDSPILASAFARYRPIAFPHEARAAPAEGIARLEVSVKDADESHPQLGDDESYRLELTPSGGSLSAATVWGALRGLESFSQLVVFDFEAGSYALEGGATTIVDRPRFVHRGLMIDTARHWQPLASIRAIVDSMTYAKLNVLHWHVVDLQSFPFESRSSPQLWEGAYSPRERYSQEDVGAVVEYARLRGVRVMVEFDMPGHAASWCVGYPELCPSKTCTTPLDVSRNGTFELIRKLLLECTGGKPSAPRAPSGLFPENMIHLGGDEVDTACWSKTPRIKAWLAEQGLTPDGGYARFVKSTAAIAIAQGRRPVQWSEVYDHFGTALPKEVVVHVWKDVTNVTEVVANGYDVIRNVGCAAFAPAVGASIAPTVTAASTRRLHPPPPSTRRLRRSAPQVRRQVVVPRQPQRGMARRLLERAVRRHPARSVRGEAARRARRDVGRDGRRLRPAADRLAAPRRHRREALVGGRRHRRADREYARPHPRLSLPARRAGRRRRARRQWRREGGAAGAGVVLRAAPPPPAPPAVILGASTCGPCGPGRGV